MMSKNQAMNRANNFKEIKVGDAFFHYSRYSEKINRVICTRVTPTRCTIGEHQYTKSDGQSYGSSDWTLAPNLYLDDIISRAQYAEQKLRIDALEAIKGLSEKSSTELLLDVHKIIREYVDAKIA